MLIHIPQDKSDPQNLGQEHIRVTDIELMRNGPYHGRESFIECPRNFQVLQEIPSVQASATGLLYNNKNVQDVSKSSKKC